MSLLPPFENPVANSQQVFRALLKSMSEPGTLGRLPEGALHPKAIPSLHHSTWSIARSLFDHDTLIYLSPKLREDSLIKSIQFQTDARITENPAEANFAILNLNEFENITEFNEGSLESPHLSCTLLIQVETVNTFTGDQANETPCFEIRGPGIKNKAYVQIADINQDQLNVLTKNHRLYPCGVDFIFCAPTDFVALPRTTKVRILEGEPACM